MLANQPWVTMLHATYKKLQVTTSQQVHLCSVQGLSVVRQMHESGFDEKVHSVLTRIAIDDRRDKP